MSIDTMKEIVASGSNLIFERGGAPSVGVIKELVTVAQTTGAKITISGGAYSIGVTKELAAIGKGSVTFVI